MKKSTPNSSRVAGSCRITKTSISPPAAALRDCLIEGITNLETSFAAAHPRALIQMATGAGKTYTACSFTYRLIKHASARRVLFLVDRANLGPVSGVTNC